MPGAQTKQPQALGDLGLRGRKANLPSDQPPPGRRGSVGQAGIGDVRKDKRESARGVGWGFVVISGWRGSLGFRGVEDEKSWDEYLRRTHVK